MKHIIIMSIFSFLFGNNPVQNQVIKVLSPEEFKVQIQDKDVQLIDVRTPA
ncbi:MAG TPA: rhodanese-like domain-containing protein, partial [Flavobacteriaceae bacterium]|nr:rhodanese-like domain-containing protein [Flavobacteriaceae bacterium]